MKCPSCHSPAVVTYTHTVPAGVRKGEQWTECANCYSSPEQPEAKSTLATKPVSVTPVLAGASNVSSSRSRTAQPASHRGAGVEGDLFSRAGQ